MCVHLGLLFLFLPVTTGARFSPWLHVPPNRLSSSLVFLLFRFPHSENSAVCQITARPPHPPPTPPIHPVRRYFWSIWQLSPRVGEAGSQGGICFDLDSFSAFFARLLRCLIRWVWGLIPAIPLCWCICFLDGVPLPIGLWLIVICCFGNTMLRFLSRFLVCFN